jgi:hypothetical protein
METIPHGAKYNKLIFGAEYRGIPKKGANLAHGNKSNVEKDE